MDRGFIKLWRDFDGHPICEVDGLCRLWIKLLLRANWKQSKRLIPGTKNVIVIPRGSLMTTQSQLHAMMYPPDAADQREWTPSPRTLWRWLEALEAMDCVQIVTVSNRCTLVTIVNYETYQSSESESVTPVSRRCHADDKVLTNDPYREEGKKERREEPPAEKLESNSEPTVEENSANDVVHSTSLLVRKWNKRRRGTKARDELERAAETFEELMRLGVPGEAIADEIDRESRVKTEPVFRMENRLLAEFGLDGNGPTKRVGPSTPDEFLEALRAKEK